MPQFAVYRAPRRNPDIPFVQQIQTSRLDRSSVRVVMPLVRVEPASPPDNDLTPRFVVQNISVFADPMNITALHLRQLGVVLEILADPDQDRIIRAIDELISRA